MTTTEHIIDEARTGYEAWRQSRWEEIAGPNGKAGLTLALPITASGQAVPDVPGLWGPGAAPGTLTWTITGADVASVDGKPVVGVVELDSDSRIDLSGARRGSVGVDGDMTMLVVWDPAAATLTGLEEILAYPFNPDWIVEAEYRPAPAGRTFATTRRWGTEALSAPADVVFELGGEQRTLSVLRFFGGLHLGYTDFTSGNGSDADGRWVSLPESPGDRLWLDLNRAIVGNHVFSPVFPCFTALEANHLPLAVTAGERMPRYAG